MLPTAYYRSSCPRPTPPTAVPPRPPRLSVTRLLSTFPGRLVVRPQAPRAERSDGRRGLRARGSHSQSTSLARLELRFLFQCATCRLRSDHQTSPVCGAQRRSLPPASVTSARTAFVQEIKDTSHRIPKAYDSLVTAVRLDLCSHVAMHFFHTTFIAVVWWDVSSAPFRCLSSVFSTSHGSRPSTFVTWW